jgi:hypothetical protein
MIRRDVPDGEHRHRGSTMMLRAGSGIFCAKNHAALYHRVVDSTRVSADRQKHLTHMRHGPPAYQITIRHAPAACPNARRLRFGTPGRSSIQPTILLCRHFRLFFLILPSRLQKPLGGGPKPKTARLAVGKSQGCLHLPDRHSPGEKFGRLLENRKIGREGILSNGRSLSVRQICTKSIHRPSRRAQAPTAPQRERAAIGPSIARQDHVLDDRIDLGLPALAGEHAVVAYTGLHVVALKIGS